eukprot:6185116-Pleurochrysis_carterae.AAC.1
MAHERRRSVCDLLAAVWQDRRDGRVLDACEVRLGSRGFKVHHVVVGHVLQFACGRVRHENTFDAEGDRRAHKVR